MDHAVPDVPTVLVRAPPDEPCVCPALVERALADGRSLVRVTTADPATVREGVGGEDLRAVVAVGGPLVDDPLVEAVPLAGDLPAIGMAVSRHADAVRALVWMDALDAVLRAVDRERAYAFLHRLSAQVAAADGRLLLCLGPAHGERAAATVASLADAVVDPTAEPSVRARPPFE